MGRRWAGAVGSWPGSVPPAIGCSRSMRWPRRRASSSARRRNVGPRSRVSVTPAAGSGPAAPRNGHGTERATAPTLPSRKAQSSSRTRTPRAPRSRSSPPLDTTDQTVQVIDPKRPLLGAALRWNLPRCAPAAALVAALARPGVEGEAGSLLAVVSLPAARKAGLEGRRDLLTARPLLRPAHDHHLVALGGGSPRMAGRPQPASRSRPPR